MLLTDTSGNKVEIDATVIASKIEEISEMNGLGCSETEWIVECIKNYNETPEGNDTQEIRMAERKTRVT